MWYRRAMKDDEAWQYTPDEFMNHHYTGHINSNAYEDYRTSDGLSWLRKESYPVEHGVYQHGDNAYQIRRNQEPLQYAKWGPKTFQWGNDEPYEGTDIMRDEKGNALYLSPEEMREKGLPFESGDLAAFHNDVPVGMASNEFGSTGVWVVDEHQKRGLGTHLLNEFRKLNPTLKNLGQMTNAGYNMSRAYHKRLVKEALERGEVVPQHVLAHYPDLIQ